MSDIVFIEDLQIETVIGIHDWEKETRQVVALDLEMANDNRHAATADRIEDTLDYKAVAKRLISFIGEGRFELVETVAERVAELLRCEFGVSWVRVRVAKPGAVTGSAAVGVIIERGER